MTSRAQNDLTPEELAELREALPLLRFLKSLVKAGGAGAGVDEAARPKVKRDREPPPEAFERVARLRRRKGLG